MGRREGADLWCGPLTRGGGEAEGKREGLQPSEKEDGEGWRAEGPRGEQKEGRDRAYGPLGLGEVEGGRGEGRVPTALLGRKKEGRPSVRGGEQGKGKGGEGEPALWGAGKGEGEGRGELEGGGLGKLGLCEMGQNYHPYCYDLSESEPYSSVLENSSTHTHTGSGVIVYGSSLKSRILRLTDVIHH